MQEKFVVLDAETSGLDPSKDRLVEIAIAWRNEGRLLSATNLINPGIHIPPEASALHHLVDNDVMQAPTRDQVLSEKGFPKGILVAHNAAFDRQFLPDFLVKREWFCTYRTALHLWPDAPNHKNMTLMYYLGLKPQLPEGLSPHRALYDVLVTTAIFEFMTSENKFSELKDLQNKPILLKFVKFGKYKGQLWSSVPKDYCKWLLIQNSDGGIDENVRFTAKHWLQN